MNVVNEVTRLTTLFKYWGAKLSVRGMETQELLTFPFIVTDTHQRFIVDPRRYVNPFAQMAETLWMLNGRNDLDWLERYIPQCKKFSDDGKTWRAAYGPRLRNWDCCGQLWVGEPGAGNWEDGYRDQIEEVINKLSEDINTRQAVISIWDPAQDWVEGSKDYPCNNWLHFIVRDDKLHLNVGVRSNDLIWGFTHNDFFGWSVLQELIAKCINVGVGNIMWNATSMHVYERHYDLLASIQRTPLFDIYEHGVTIQELDVTRLEDFDRLVSLIIGLSDASLDIDLIKNVEEGSSWMLNAMTLLYAHSAYFSYKKWSADKELADFHLTRVGELLMTLPNMLDMKIAALYWIWQKVGDHFWNFVILSEEERDLLHRIHTHA